MDLSNSMGKFLGKKIEIEQKYLIPIIFSTYASEPDDLIVYNSEIFSQIKLQFSPDDIAMIQWSGFRDLALRIIRFGDLEGMARDQIYSYWKDLDIPIECRPAKCPKLCDLLLDRQQVEDIFLELYSALQEFVQLYLESQHTQIERDMVVMKLLSG